jgi:hypothetical protein
MNDKLKQAIKDFTYYDSNNIKQSGKSIILNMLKLERKGSHISKIINLKLKLKTFQAIKKRCDYFIKNQESSLYAQDFYNNYELFSSFISENAETDSETMPILNAAKSSLADKVSDLKQKKFLLQLVSFKIYILQIILDNLSKNTSSYDTIIKEIEGL